MDGDGQAQNAINWLQAHGHKAIVWLIFIATLIEWINSGGDISKLTQALALGQIGS